MKVTYEVSTNQAVTPELTIHLGTTVTAYASGSMGL